MGNTLKGIIDKFLIEDYVDETAIELKFESYVYDVIEKIADDCVEVRIYIGSVITAKEMKRYISLMKKIDKKYSRILDSSIGSDKKTDNVFIKFYIPLKVIIK